MRQALVVWLSGGRARLTTAGLSIGLTVALSEGVVWYVDQRCDSPALGFLSLIAWVTLLIALAWLTLMALSPQLIGPQPLEEWAGRDARALEITPLDEFDPRRHTVNPQSRFRLLFTLMTMAPLLLTHTLHNSFLTRYQREGSARIYLRSPDHLTRLKGLNHLADQAAQGRTIHISDALRDALLALLQDPHEGVRARAAFVTGAVRLTEAAEPLERIALTDEALRDVALLALGQLLTPPLRPNPAHDALRRLAARVEVRSAAPYPLAIALGSQRLTDPQSVESLRAIYTLARGVGGDAKAREAAVWALGETRDPAHVRFLGDALADEALSVRCLAANALEKLVAFESSPPLRAAFERSARAEECPLIETPTQQGGAAVVMMPKWSYQLTLIRALATTDDPLLLEWLVAHQHGVDPMTHRLMNKYYEALLERDKEGVLEDFKRRNAARERVSP
jgi:HEAT repeat protein